MSDMATNGDTMVPKKLKPLRLGLSAATGRFVLAPAVTGKGSVSDKRIAAAVKGAFTEK